MEAFSLLKYWRVCSHGGNGVKTTDKQQQQQQQQPITTTVSEMTVEEEEEECVVDGEGDDEGPFFDLEFEVPHEEEEEEKDECDDGDSVTDDDDEDGFDFTVSPGSVSSGGNQIDSSSSSSPNNLTFSPSDDSFFKRDDLLLLQSPPCSSTTSSSSVENSTNPKVQFPVSLIKTASKIRVFILGFKSKPKLEDQNREKTEKKLRVDEIIPSQEEIEDDEEKKLITKDVVQKYLKMIKPLYVRVSKRYNNNGGAFSPSGSMSSSVIPIPSSPLKIEAEEPSSSKNLSNLPNRLRIVRRKHVGKSRSSSSSVNPVTATTNSSGIQAKRRDDSLLQQEDGIQSAILHCKRSFNASRDTDSCCRSSSSEESHEISIDEAKK